MKLNRNNILLLLFLIVILVFSICISSRNTLIETNVNYGLDDCVPELQKVLNNNTDASIIHLVESCSREYKAWTSDASNCNGYNIMNGNNNELCSGGQYGLGVYNE